MGAHGRPSGTGTPDNPNISSIHAGAEAKRRLLELARYRMMSLSAVVMAFLRPHLRGTLAESARALEEHERATLRDDDGAQR